MDNNEKANSWANSDSSQDTLKLKEKYNPPIEEFYFLKIGHLWDYFKAQHFSFWMISFYLFFEYARPQALFPEIAFIPWAQLCLIGSLWGAVVDKTVGWVSSPLNKWLIMFAIVIYLSSINAYYPEVSEIYYIDFYSWFVVYFLIINIVNTKQRLYLFLIVFILCAAKIAIGTSKTFILRGFSFTDWGLMGPVGYFQNSGELSILMLTLFPVVFLLYGHLKDKIGKLEKLVLIIFWVTPIITILGASSRGAQVALLIQLLFMFRTKIFRIKPLIVLILVSFILYNILPEEQKLRFTEAGEDKTSQQRILYWQHGWDMLIEYPALGVGYFNFAEYYGTHFPEDMLYDEAQLPHNIFIQVGTDAGFLGLIPFFFLLFSPFLAYRKSKINVRGDPFLKVVTLGVLYGIFGFILAGQFVTVTYYPFLWIGLSFLVASQHINNKLLDKKN